MKIRKYTGATAYEAMMKLKSDLGPDAVVLNTRTVKQRGFLGFLKKPLIEVTAAYKEEKLKPSSGQETNSWDRLNREITDIRNMVHELSTSKKPNPDRLPRKLIDIRTELVANGIKYDIAKLIIEEINQQINIENKSETAIKDIVKHKLVEYLGDVDPLSIKPGEQKVVFFLGPTGVGKTTTLAKIAGQLVLQGGLNIGLITSDTYRIAAVDQLKTYSNILDLPLKVIYNESDLFKSLTSFSNKDLIFIDTAGRSHKDLSQNDALYKMLQSTKNKEVYLVLSATTDYNTLASIIKHYKIIGNYKIIFTKLDEVQGFGSMINARVLTNNPFSYITTGQNVPDDIEVLNKERIASSLIGEISHGRSS